METNLKELIATAKAIVNTYSVEEARTKVNSRDYVFIDVREKEEIESEGSIPGSVNIPRGMLEFTIDKSSPYYNPVFESGKSFIFYCKSGGRSLLAALRAVDMGLSNVANMDGGFMAWKK